MYLENRVFGYFNKNNYEYLEEIKNRLMKDNIKASKSKLLELGVIELRKMDYEEIKRNMGEMV